jgi:glycosyltransferase involved in cell wall biosynthesis
MRVALDARTVYAPSRRGTGKNLVDLYRTLARLRPTWEFVMVHQRVDTDDPFEGQTNIRRVAVDIRGDRFNLWQEIRLPLAARAAGADVLHCPANLAPTQALTPTVVTIHDLIPLDVAPKDPATARWLRRVRRAARQARRIITPSEYTRTRIVNQLEASERKVTVNPWAPDQACQRVTSDTALERVRQKYAIPGRVPFVLAFGAEDPRKNTTRVIDAWSTLPADVRRMARLLVVGLQPRALAHYQSVVATRPGDGSCLLHGFADEADLAPLLSAAIALCYPSRSEGFGLPVLDAFACGTPVITSSTTSLPEVAGDAALLVDPEDTGSIASALGEILQSAETRDRLRAAGARRLTAFSWQRCAETAAGVLASAAGRGGQAVSENR